MVQKQKPIEGFPSIQRQPAIREIEIQQLSGNIITVYEQANRNNPAIATLADIALRASCKIPEAQLRIA